MCKHGRFSLCDRTLAGRLDTLTPFRAIRQVPRWRTGHGPSGKLSALVNESHEDAQSLPVAHMRNRFRFYLGLAEGCVTRDCLDSLSVVGKK